MVDPNLSVNVYDGRVGVIAAHVHIENYYESSPPVAKTIATGSAQVPPCPYPGLAYFGPGDGKRFFGREAAIKRLLVAVRQHQFTAIVGASGSGKSSLALAGLAPRLHEDGSWIFSHFRIGTEPTKNPFLAIARAATPFLSDGTAVDQLSEVQKLARDLEGGTVDLSNVLAACRARHPGKRMLIIADQFEEVFTLVADESLRERFIRTLTTAFVDAPPERSPEASLLVTLRADFYGTALQYHPLPNALRGRVENLGRMTREELREAIVRPAGDIRFEAGVVDTVLDAVESRPGGLPLLQFALREMWSRQENSCITRGSYDAIGGVDGAIAKRAESIFAELTDSAKDVEQARLFKRLFTRLVTLGQGTEDTRRVVDSEELGEAWPLAQRLAGENNRLIVTTSIADGHETAEVVHEALIRNWPTLIEWISRDRDFQSWLRRLRASIEDWRRDPCDEGVLLRGGPLVSAEDWYTRRRDDLNKEERTFIEASISKDKQAKETEARRKEREARFFRRALVVAVSALIVVLGVAVWAERNRELAVQAQEVAEFVATAMSHISSSVSAKASELSESTRKAVKSDSKVERARAYLTFARYFEREWNIGKALDALSKADDLISTLPDDGPEAGQKTDLLASSHELAGDVNWAEWSRNPADKGKPFVRSVKEYRSAIDLLSKSSGSEKDIVRMRCKLALALVFATRVNVNEAYEELRQAEESSASGDDTKFEQALVKYTRARLLIETDDMEEAAKQLRQAVDLLQSWMDARHGDTDDTIELASWLQILGDLQRRSGDPDAYSSYTNSNTLFHIARMQDPTAFAISTGVALNDVGISLLEKRSQTDIETAEKRSAQSEKFDAAFSRGIGRFQFGMTTAGVAQLLGEPKDSLSNLPIAWEWRMSKVPYLVQNSLSSLPDFDGFVHDTCLGKNSQAIFMFHEDKLFQIVVRFLKNRGDVCPYRTSAIDDFAHIYNDLPVTGGGDEKKIRYETSLVGLYAYETQDAVNLNFVWR